MKREIEICQVSEHYSKTLEALDSASKISEIDLDGTNISEAIFFHLSKMKYAGWKHRVEFNRARKHSISEFFQDIIAFYLKASLNNEYQIVLEPKIKKTQPDILIKRGDENLFIVEVKTNIGWNRPDGANENPYKEFEKRVHNLSNNFSISKENVIYIFEEHGNVNKDFSNQFWDKKNGKPKSRPVEFPFSIIYPLFNQTDPYYWKEYSKLKRAKAYANIANDEIQKRAKENIVCSFEGIIKKIIACK